MAPAGYCWYCTQAGKLQPPGADTVNVDAPEVAPPGLATETWAVPAVAMSAAAIAAVNCVLLEKLVVRDAPFQRTAAPETKLLPLTVSVKAGPPAVALAGTSELIAGADGGGALPPSLIMLATDGTPVPLSMKSMYMPGGARFALAGAVMSMLLPLLLNCNVLMRWFWSK